MFPLLPCTVAYLATLSWLQTAHARCKDGQGRHAADEGDEQAGPSRDCDVHAVEQNNWKDVGTAGRD